MDWVPKKSPLNKGLFVRNPFLYKALQFLNFLSPRQKKESLIPENPKKILICNLANFGDVVISTTVLPVLKKRYPNCEIGYLTATATGKAVLKDHPLVSKVHFFDHWYLNRFRCKAALHHIKSSRQALKEIREERYDLAIDLYSYFPNAIPFLARAKIPVRIGYPTGGFSNLLTHSVAWTFQDRYVGWAHLHLLEVLGIEIQKESPLPSYNYKKKTGEYVVFHMGSTSVLKEWDVKQWIQLALRFEAFGWAIVLTGKGDRERKLCREVASSTKAKNLCDQLDWMEFVMTIQEAKVVITVDTAAVHIAAGSLTPTIVLYAGINSPHMWVPPFHFCKLLMNRVACAPCFNKKGCVTMDCIRGIRVEDVYQCAIQLQQKNQFVTV